MFNIYHNIFLRLFIFIARVLSRLTMFKTCLGFSDVYGHFYETDSNLNTMMFIQNYTIYVSLEMELC